MSNSLKIRDINQNFILASLNQERNGLTDLFAKYREILDWDWLLTFSQNHKISGIFISNLDRLGITGQLPPKTQRQINLIKNKAQQRVHQANSTLKQLNEVLTQKDIPFLVLKGCVFADELYEDPTIRPFHDIDLLIPQKLLKKTEEILVLLGYKFYSPSVRSMDFIPLGHTPQNIPGLALPEDVTKQLFKCYHFHFPFVLPKEDKRLPIDLHWQLFYSGVLKIDSDSLWKYTREKNINNITVRTLSLEASLLYLATTIATDGPEDFQLRPLCDLLRHLEVFGNKLNPQLLKQLVEEWGAKDYLEFSLKLIKKLLNFNNIPIFKHIYKKSLWSGLCFHLASNRSILIEPISTKNTVLKKITCSMFWDLAMLRPPQRSIKNAIRAGIQFCQNRGLLRNAYN